VFPPDILDQMETRGKISYESISHGENTILSSNSSGASLIPRPEASRDIFILSPHPQLNADEVNSLPTINTEYYSFERVFRDQRFDGRNHDDGESLSTASHSSMNVGVLSQNRQVLGSCEDVVVNRTSDHLINDLADGRRGIYWYDRLVSGSDWDQFRVVSKQFLKILSEESKTSPPCILPLPPISTARAISSSSRDLQDLVYRPEEFLPPDFICGICKDVIVGACILDCKCSSSTVCEQCWECGDCDQQDFANRMDFVWIESKKCPTCLVNAEIKVHCHTLDVAILRIIETLPDSDANVSFVKQKYYSRLSNWRKIVTSRNERYARQKSIRDDELLARLIQEEERIFWDNRTSRSRNRPRKTSEKIKLLSQAALALLAAAGLKLMAKR